MLQNWQEKFDNANAGFLKPRDMFFLPWATAFAGLFFAYAIPWVRSRIGKWQSKRLKFQEIEDQQLQTEQLAKKKQSGRKYHDLETAITFFSNKAKRIDALDIDEDEKEMLQMKLQEKKERAMEQYV